MKNQTELTLLISHPLSVYERNSQLFYMNQNIRSWLVKKKMFLKAKNSQGLK